MLVLGNGDVLETGSSVDPETGEERGYEELWGEIPLDTYTRGGGDGDGDGDGNDARGRGDDGQGGVVLKLDDVGGGYAGRERARGMVIRIGGWCQGVLRMGEGFTVERWERGGVGWERIFREGVGEVPCGVVCEGVGEGGREGEVVEFGGGVWRVVEVWEGG